jgi:L-2-aminoadipate reductase
VLIQIHLLTSPSVFVPLNRMPLNPNGKIDKPALPFPDTAQAAHAERQRGMAKPKVSPTEEVMQAIWSRLLPNAPHPVPTDESFFDLGGHSILATRLIFEIRKSFVIDAPLGLVFDKPTLSSLAAEVDILRNADLGLAVKERVEVVPPSSHLAVPSAPAGAPVRIIEYMKDLDNLIPKLRSSYAPLPDDFGTRPLTVFLTGATGFLGAFILRDLLQKERVKKVVCLIRAKDSDTALQRLRELSTDRGAWDEGWVTTGRIEAIAGDLNLASFGLKTEEWNTLASEADVIVHNGAFVSVNVPYQAAKILLLCRFIGYILTRNWHRPT